MDYQQRSNWGMGSGANAAVQGFLGGAQGVTGIIQTIQNMGIQKDEMAMKQQLMDQQKQQQDFQNDMLIYKSSLEMLEKDVPDELHNMAYKAIDGINRKNFTHFGATSADQIPSITSFKREDLKPYIKQLGNTLNLVSEGKLAPSAIPEIIIGVYSQLKSKAAKKDFLALVKEYDTKSSTESYYKKQGQQAENTALNLFTQGTAQPTGYLKPTNLSADYASQTGGMSDVLQYQPATQAQLAAAISALPHGSEVKKALMEKFVPKKEKDAYHYVQDDSGQVFEIEKGSGTGNVVSGAKGKTKDTTGQEYKLDEKTLKIKKQAAGLAIQELGVKYGRDVMIVDPVTGMSGVNPNYGTPDQRNTIFREWQTLTNKHLPQSLKTEIPKETSKPTGQRKPLSSFMEK